MQKDNIFPLIHSTETKQQMKQRHKLEKTQQKIAKKQQKLKEKQEAKMNGTMSPGWNKFTVLSTNLPSFGRGLCWIGGFILIMTLLFFLWFGILDPKVILEIAKAGLDYLMK